MTRVVRRPDFDIVRFEGMLTVAPQMLEFFELLKRVARSGSSVLIRGETGTGKELVAGALHRHSPRGEGPFEAINCATLTAELLASELFGHVRGAFTGAIRDRIGRFRLADGGSIFLDEIAEIAPEIQARLLRVLQERTFVPLGAADPVSVDVRLLAATNKALREEVAVGRFREDLMYRVRVVPIWLPRLVEREGDVEALAWTFVAEFNRRGLRRVEGISAGARDALLAYAWPGNVRELRNVVEYAFAVGEGPVLTVDELTPELRGEAPPPSRRPDQRTAADQERDRILTALQRAGGRKTEAAELLDMSRSTLWRKMKMYGI